MGTRQPREFHYLSTHVTLITDQPPPTLTYVNCVSLGKSVSKPWQTITDHLHFPESKTVSHSSVSFQCCCGWSSSSLWELLTIYIVLDGYIIAFTNYYYYNIQILLCTLRRRMEGIVSDWMTGDGPMPIDLWQPETAKNASQPTTSHQKSPLTIQFKRFDRVSVSPSSYRTFPLAHCPTQWMPRSSRISISFRANYAAN